MRTWAFVLLLLAPLVSARAEEDLEAPEKKPKQIAFAVIVNAKNPLTKVSFHQLRGYLKVDRQFWPNKKRCDIYLPPRKSAAYDLLLKKVYRMSHKKLQKYWVRKLFSGQIPAKPSFAASWAAAGKQVQKSLGGVSIVPADAVPKNVKVLLIDGKKPGEKGYALAAPAQP